jgi:hypothetical protein
MFITGRTYEVREFPNDDLYGIDGHLVGLNVNIGFSRVELLHYFKPKFKYGK